ncbi:MAG: sensor histidine kinase N-terminal domain-containing protein [Rhodocyclaceae bacterium]|jgi:two-component system sensor histidine kinase TctE|nr:sensor histidine kinase N-terminal domain-containing protein [Rhodocyclaceae bacterium]MCO5099013.1 sensor histidine kinase N-terminal domain-containing protein [Rhodocyclaceae bacterium]
MALSDRLRRKRPEEAERQSVFGEILDWMLMPLLLIWPLSVILIQNVASSIADDPYDQHLAENAMTLARSVSVEDNWVHIKVDRNTPVRSLLRSDEMDEIYFQVLGFKNELVAGDLDIHWVEPPLKIIPEQVYFRDDDIKGEGIRIAYLYLMPKPGQAPILVQVAETRNKRKALASRILSGVTLPHFAVIPLAVLLVWIGLGRGIEPLNRLGRMIRRRMPTDLSPIPTAGVPEEVKPVIYAFNDMMARLEQNLQSQQRFIGDAAHQMRTPLTGLKMQTELALSETDPELVRASLRQIAESADHAAHLINQLLVLARAESSHEKTHSIEKVDLEALVRQTTLEWVPAAMAKRIDLGFEGTGWPLQISGNLLLLRELTANLIDNAVKYTPQGGRVTVRTRVTEFAVLEIEDDGPGIPDNESELVFERFYRVLGNEAQGSGLGLAIVREIADLHLGSIQLKPSPSGLGTLAQVVFPRRRFTVSALLAQAPEKFQPTL